MQGDEVVLLALAGGKAIRHNKSGLLRHAPVGRAHRGKMLVGQDRNYLVDDYLILSNSP